MATNQFSYSFPISVGLIEPHYKSLEDLTEILQQELPAPFLCGISRNGWLLDRVVNLGHAFKLPRLARFDRTLLLVAQDEVALLLRDIDILLATAESTPEKLTATLDQWDAQEILDALRTSQEAAVPHLGPESGGEGDDPRYLFAWLKSLRSVALAAQVTGKCLVQVRPR